MSQSFFRSLLAAENFYAPVTAIVLLLGGLLILSSCAESAHQVHRNGVHIDVPPELEKQIDTSVAFADLYAAPGNYVGRVIMVGGLVIRAKRTEDRTELRFYNFLLKQEGPRQQSDSAPKGVSWLSEKSFSTRRLCLLAHRLP